MKSFRIAERQVGTELPTFIIAELSANHNQDFETAVATIRAAKTAGADAIKLQTYTPDTITVRSDKTYFKINQGTIWDGKTLYDLYQEAYTPWEWQDKLKKVAESEGLVCFSTPFDKTAVDFLEKIHVPAYKIASFEITDIPLIEYVASKGKPVIISTGIATLSDIEEAVNACRRVGNEQIALLKCTSQYPAPVEEANLNTIPNMAETFNVVVGISDHTMELAVPIAAVALGARIIEKHFILDRSIPSPDAAFSLNPEEFRQMVNAVRQAERSLGKVSYELSEKVRRSREHSRSLFAVKDIKAGEALTEENIRSIRPAYGLAPKYLKDVLGRKASVDIPMGTPLRWNLIE